MPGGKVMEGAISGKVMEAESTGDNGAHQLEQGVVVPQTQSIEVEQQHHQDDGVCSLLGPHSHRHSSQSYDKSLPCFGCGIGWFSFLVGFIFPVSWYLATFLYLRKYHLKDPRERAGLAASAIAALICSVAALVALLAVML